MKRACLMFPLLMLGIPSATSAACAATQAHLIVPNLDENLTACHIHVSLNTAKCADQTCVFPVSIGAATEPEADRVG